MSDPKQQPRIDEVFLPKLKEVIYPGFEMDIVAMGLVEEAVLEGGKATIKLKPLAAPPEVREVLEDAIAAAVASVPGMEELALEIPEPKTAPEPKGPAALPGVKNVIAVASGKGGVGKSTVAVNLALGLAELGLKAGILDLDLYGPSIPTMLGIEGKQPGITPDNKMLPLEVQGVKALSIGLLLQSEKALIWRGPLIMKAVKQMLHDTNWAPLDVLVLDLPPGTGDVQITMAQEVPVTGAVVVTTPQDVALIDAIRAVDLFHQVGAPVMGIVENMSYFTCPDCGGRHEIFGHGSVEPLAARLGVDFLGELPLNTAVRRFADGGTPVVASGEAAADPYVALASRVAAKLEAM